MKINSTKLIGAIALAIILPLLSGCFTILEVDQPAAVKTGGEVAATLAVRTEGTDANPHHGIVGLLIPNDWIVNLVTYSGDFGPDTCIFVHPDSIDSDPGGKVDFWTDSLEVRYPSGDGMQWVVYQAKRAYASTLDTGYVDVAVKMTAGTTTGKFNIGYFVSNAALDFTDPTYYSVSLTNAIEIGGTGVDNQATEKPTQFSLLQNYPNPFNAATIIAYDLPVAGMTTLKVYNLLGKEVASLANGYNDAGSHRVIFDGSSLKSGIYYYRIQSGNFVATKKFVLVK